MSTRVALARCAGYDLTTLKKAISGALSFIGSLEEVVKPGQRVLLKINHLGHHPPEAAVTTHPGFLRAVVELVREITDDIVVADGLDRPGLDGFAISGILRVSRELGVELLNFKGGGYREVRRTSFEMVRALPMAEAALDADVVITLPKLKTHMLCLMTGAVKNNYGFLPERLRVNLHGQLVYPDDFSNLVVDIFDALKPRLAIMDAVVALEGTGPSSGGTPKPLGLVIAGRDSVAVDAVASAVMGLHPTDVASTRHAARRGLGEADLARIEVVGESLKSARSPFRLPANRALMEALLPRLPAAFLRMVEGLLRRFREYPRIIRTRCVGCNLCVKHCAERAVSVVDGKAKIDYAGCIACFCCQEFCESNAVSTCRRPLGHVFTFAARTRNAFGRLVRLGRDRP
jgi:uncharacterized protein (DUF362 family)/Pyruvate/2-oxoacid:ferredoxin oxidoreductase delta subunit